MTRFNSEAQTVTLTDGREILWPGSWPHPFGLHARTFSNGRGESVAFARQVINSYESMHGCRGSLGDVVLMLQSQIGSHVIDGLDLLCVLSAFDDFLRQQRRKKGGSRGKLSPTSLLALDLVCSEILSEEFKGSRAIKIQERLELQGHKISLPTIRKKIKEKAT